MEVLTAADSEAAQRRIAGALHARGLRPGDRVLLAADPRAPGRAGAPAAVLDTVLAALRRAVVPVLPDPSLPPGEAAALERDADPALVVRGAGALAELRRGPPVDLADVPLTRPMHYTSGTTGRRKGVWTGVLDESAARALAAEEQELWGFDTTDRHLVLAPLHHSAPLRFAVHTLLAGGDVVLPGPFDVATVARALAEHRPTTVFAVPTHLQRLLAAGPPPLGGVRLLAHAGAPCPEPLKRAVLDAFPDDAVWEFYGSTEAQFTACSAAEWRQRPGTVGRARPGRELRTDPDGRIWCRLPPHARFAYWRDPARTAEARRGDGEITVGDLGELDGDGYLFLRGRRTDLVITGGVNVYPLEVEQVLDACPGVRESAVFGVDDPRWGQRVVAAVVGTAGEAALRAWARERLAPARRPKQYLVLDELPRTSSGKVRRTDLPALLG